MPRRRYGIVISAACTATDLVLLWSRTQLIPTLRSNEYFGQYGKISKIIVTKRTAPGSSSSVVGLYITYHRREDATRCITLVDGAPPPGSGSEVMRASYGTTKYCMAFLRGVSCSDHSCMNLHEWGDEKDCFTKEDLTTLCVYSAGSDSGETDNFWFIASIASKIQKAGQRQARSLRRKVCVMGQTENCVTDASFQVHYLVEHHGLLKNPLG
jgi:hypothetical protein